MYFKIELIYNTLESGPTHISLIASFCESDQQFYNPVSNKICWFQDNHSVKFVTAKTHRQNLKCCLLTHTTYSYNRTWVLEIRLLKLNYIKFSIPQMNYKFSSIFSHWLDNSFCFFFSTTNLKRLGISFRISSISVLFHKHC